MNHKQKIKLARKMRTQQELVNKVPIFQSAEWTKRAESKAKKTGSKRKKQVLRVG